MAYTGVHRCDEKAASFGRMQPGLAPTQPGIGLKPTQPGIGMRMPKVQNEIPLQAPKSFSPPVVLLASENLPPPSGYPPAKAISAMTPVSSPTTAPASSPKSAPASSPKSAPASSPKMFAADSPMITRMITPTGSPTMIAVQTSSPQVRAILKSQRAKPKPKAVEYFSSSRNEWIPGTFEGFNTELGTYTLDVKAFARPGDVRLAPGADVEYYSNSKGTWIPAEVINFNDEIGVYTLDVQPFARPECLRLKGFEECLQPPNGKYQELLLPEQAEIPEPPDVVNASIGKLTPSDQIPVSAVVEYFSSSRGDWIPATVDGFDEAKACYCLDVRPFALACNIRLPSVDPEVESEAPIPQFKVEKYKSAGEVWGNAVFFEATSGVMVRAFDQQVVEFELSCSAEALQTWLQGMTLQMLPGLLTFLQEEATAKHVKIEALKKEKESYRGKLDYGFFGLDEKSCTEKDIDRAYRKAARDLHPDKGGDETKFQEMQEMYEEIKAMREDKEMSDSPKEVQVQEADPMTWDPSNRESMLKAHETMRAFLLWVSNDMKTLTEEVEELRKRWSRLTGPLPRLENDLAGSWRLPMAA